jgi:hypothetical protein
MRDDQDRVADGDSADSDDVGRAFRLMSAGVVERPLDGFDLSIMGCVRSSGDGFGGALFAQAVAAEL